MNALKNNLFVISVLAFTLVMAAAVPQANASISDDLSNPDLALIDVYNNALQAGQSVDATIKALFEQLPDQSANIVATAISATPDQLRSVIKAALNAGIRAKTVMKVAITNGRGHSLDRIVAMVVHHLKQMENVNNKDALSAAVFASSLPSSIAVKRVACGLQMGLMKDEDAELPCSCPGPETIGTEGLMYGKDTGLYCSTANLGAVSSTAVQQVLAAALARPVQSTAMATGLAAAPVTTQEPALTEQQAYQLLDSLRSEPVQDIDAAVPVEEAAASPS